MTGLTTIAGQTDTTLTPDLDPAQRPAEPKVNGLVDRKVTDLIPYGRNSRSHGEAQIAQIAASIKEFGFTNPVLIDEHDTIIAGEGRVQAAKKLKMLTLPCIVLVGLTEAQKAAYVIADNKLALNAGWDDELLLAELGRIAELDFEMSLTGFSEVEMAELMDSEFELPGPGAEELAIAVVGPQPAAGQSESLNAPATEQTKPRDAWQGMPDYRQPKAGPFRTIKVHCKDQAAVDAFATLVGQKLTEKTKSVWYPDVVKTETGAVYA